MADLSSLIGGELPIKPFERQCEQWKCIGGSLCVPDQFLCQLCSDDQRFDRITVTFGWALDYALELGCGHCGKTEQNRRSRLQDDAVLQARQGVGADCHDEQYARRFAVWHRLKYRFHVMKKLLRFVMAIGGKQLFGLIDGEHQCPFRLKR
ncbi:hypothetical protein D9M73_138580 [compost metagenome]